MFKCKFEGIEEPITMWDCPFENNLVIKNIKNKILKKTLTNYNINYFFADCSLSFLLKRICLSDFFVLFENRRHLLSRGCFVRMVELFSYW